ncbi:MAG: hypothetical protein IJZ35_01370 [Clostridia bacterium]|nr:hypothetical protein [Clostridia bacterium]
MLETLYAANIHFRKNRPLDESSTSCTVFRQGNLLEIAVPSVRCKHDLAGGCIMCNYGIGKPLSSLELIKAQFYKHLEEIGEELDTLILCTNGSFFDEGSLTNEVQTAILDIAQKSVAKTIIIETHIDTLSRDLLERIREILFDKQVILELGLESSNVFIQEYCYLKKINLGFLSDIINYGHKLGLEFQLNIILGAPFLSESERLYDSKQSIEWALNHKAMVVLFPMNIKPFTLLNFAYENGLYEDLSHWLMPILLNLFSAEELENIDIAWYGNREIKYSNAKTIFPSDCSFCHKKLQSFYENYAISHNGNERKKMVEEVLKLGIKDCNCLHDELNKVQNCNEVKEIDVISQMEMLIERLKSKKII